MTHQELYGKYLKILKVQFKLTLLPNLIIAAALMYAASVLFGLRNLDALASSFVLERFVSLIGIILITPVFLPEADKNIAEIAESKHTPMSAVHMIRLLSAVAAVYLMIGIFAELMLMMSCNFDAATYIAGTFATAYFLGSAGFASYALTDNPIVGYMLPLGYFAFNISSLNKYLKNFYLFSLADNSFEEKYWLLAAGTVLISAGFMSRFFIRRIR